MIPQGLMKSLHVVEEEILCQTILCLGDLLLLVQIDFLLLNRSPQPLDKVIVEYSTPTIHADADAVLFQATSKLQAGKRAALISIENCRFVIFRCLHLLNRG